MSFRFYHEFIFSGVIDFEFIEIILRLTKLSCVCSVVNIKVGLQILNNKVDYKLLAIQSIIQFIMIFYRLLQKRSEMAERMINKIARLEFPTVRIEDLHIGEKYKITEFKMANTKYGKKVMATLDNECDIFLPARVSSALLRDPKEYEFHQVKIIEGVLYIRFLEGPYNRCEFLYETNEETTDKQ